MEVAGHQEAPGPGALLLLPAGSLEFSTATPVHCFEVSCASRFGWRLMTLPHPPPKGEGVGDGREERLTKSAALTPFLDVSLAG